MTRMEGPTATMVFFLPRRRAMRRQRSRRTVPDRELTALWGDRFAAAMPLPAAPLQSVLAGYWHLVRRAM